MPLWTVIYSVAFWPALVLVCGCAFVLGLQPIRTAATTVLIGMVAGQVALSNVAYSNPETGLAIADLALLAGLTWSSIRWERWWLVGLSAIQMLMVLGHLARWLSAPLSRLTYAILTGGGAYLQLVLLALALLMREERRDRHV